ncbi:histidinol dehydrogenase [Petrotoga sp. 9PWA.NaAc.5.4]|uniref:histidinol dehydrogenase n=1 Tax=Petrotoga sp. 9PWA.NaAc.5.4 TaxID=1434328 RepID=UPI000CC0FF99|nr:histidinol dehydrogenase [Petrotoga sp. 9PWA.NaAc.5.4]PNR92269.1 histidinol dehydrogenase [Petrotoga sp. 9PWA.NaAc.5.4]
MNLQVYVSEILDDIRSNGISALKKYSQQFDNYKGPFELEEKEWNIDDEILQEDKNIIDRIIKRLENYHSKQIKEDITYTNEYGSMYGLIKRPINRIGIYVPGGRPLPSSLLMVAIPAKIAGVKDMIITSSPKNGKINPYILYIAKKLNIKEVYKIGGIQAIGAMAYGIGMKKVDKIFGPGNQYVNEAKRQVFGDVGIDSLAGPSEICLIADETANKEYVLNDLLSQLEHGLESKSFLLTTSKQLYDYCDKNRIERYLFDTLDECAEKANEIAPEHLEIITREPEKIVPLIQNAGAVYLGEYTPVPAADYFLGVNHVLPTGKAARFSSVLNVSDFMKEMTIAKISKEELLTERYLGIRMAEIEGMNQHKKSMEVRK